MEEIWSSVDKSIRDLFENLGLTEYYPAKITIEKAKDLATKQIAGKKGIPCVFLANVLNPCYEGRSIFFEGQNANDNGLLSDDLDDFDWDVDTSSENTEMYSSLDIAVVVLSCCNNACKQFLAQKLHASDLSVPYILPNITDKDMLIVQSSVLRGITQEAEFNCHVPIVSFLTVNGRPILKTKLLNTLLVDDAYKPFYDTELEAGRANDALVKRIFLYGLIEAALSRPHECTCQHSSTCGCTFKNVLLLLNLYGTSSDFKTQEKLICKISTLVAIIIDTGKLAGNNKAISNIKEIIDNSKHVLIVFMKEDDSTLDECKRGIQELKDVIKGSGAQVIILYHRGTGDQDNIDMVRGNMKKKINNIIEKMEDLDNTSLREHLNNLDMSNVRSDEDEI